MREIKYGKEKPKVAFLSAKMSLGGAERVISNLVNGLSSEVEVHTLLLSDQTQHDYPLGGTVVSLNDGKKRSRLAEIPYYCSKIKKYVEENEIDCIISFMEYPNLLNILTPLKIRKVISVRNFMSEKWKGNKGLVWKLSFKYLYKRADIIVVPTKLIGKDLVDNYKIPHDKLKLINNPYELEKLTRNTMEDIPKEHEHWFNGSTIITMGNLSFAKGHCHLIRSFADVKKQIPAAKLVILGEGGYRNKLKHLIEDLNLSNDVLLLGFQSNPHKYINKADIYVLSSYYEGFPNALAEAMACGLPVISTDCKSGPREILAPDKDINVSTSKIEYAKHGILIPVFKEECFNEEELSIEESNLARAIIKLFEEESLYKSYKKQSSERVQDFHIKNILNNWLKEINS
ncbi:glycosyltransferase [Priestia endophytica]|uniref:glycosyltransferase n=1 Tax=Priestia endophytica TaxID=135735 RepID=UPI002E21F774|nr:glycosyltransferase [Priestia endophytica]